MIEILRQLLKAEETGRREGAECEATGEQLLADARAESERIAQRMMAETQRQVEALEADAAKTTSQQCEAIQRESAEAVDQMRWQSAERRGAAVARAVAMLLDDPESPFAGKPRS